MTDRRDADTAPAHCLNCGAAVSHHFCAVCGQRWLVLMAAYVATVAAVVVGTVFTATVVL